MVIVTPQFLRLWDPFQMAKLDPKYLRVMGWSLPSLKLTYSHPYKMGVKYHPTWRNTHNSNCNNDRGLGAHWFWRWGKFSGQINARDRGGSAVENLLEERSELKMASLG